MAHRPGCDDLRAGGAGEILEKPDKLTAKNMP
jgi:hypothetical protein